MKLFLTLFSIVFICYGIQNFSLCQTQTNQVDSAKAVKLLSAFVGEWSGEATAYFPRDKEKKNRKEKVEITGKTILGGSYIECNSNWTQSGGENRELNIYLNYDNKKAAINILFLYDDWPGKVTYPLGYDDKSRTLTGVDTFTTSKGVKGKERVEWWISEDHSIIVGREYNHYETDPEDYWPMSFEFEWRKK
jgi:Protein of unknown function (DUF1579)